MASLSITRELKGKKSAENKQYSKQQESSLERKISAFFKYIFIKKEWIAKILIDFIFFLS